jgi:Ca2+-binding RTX toxin-like protein
MRSTRLRASFLLVAALAVTPLPAASAGSPGTCAGVATTIIGTEGADVIRGTDRRDVISGEGGRDRIYGLGGNDLICGGDGGDRIEGGRGNDVILGLDDVDRLYGGGGDDRVFGGNSGDHVHGGYGDDELHTGAVYPVRGYPDYVFVDPGNDLLVGGHDQSILNAIGAPRGVEIDMLAGTISGMGRDRVTSRFGVIIGSDHADRITGSEEPDLIDPAWGNDVVQGAGGVDWITDNEPGRDVIRGGAGDDHLTVSGRGSRAFGGPDGDTFDADDHAAAYGGYGDDWAIPRGDSTFDGDAGTDSLLLYFIPGSMRAELGTGVARGRNLITFESVENLGGTDHDDVLIGDEGANFLDGGPGNDVLRARGGDDRLQGQSGVDTQYGGEGTDTCSAGTNYGCEGFESEPLF